MDNVSEAAVVLPSQDRRIENVLWHPTAEGILSVSTDTCVKLFDVVAAAEKCGKDLIICALCSAVIGFHDKTWSYISI